MRWYDLEPDVCIAISMIECAAHSKQVKCAEFIIKEIQNRDVEYNYIKNITHENLNGKYCRWYDKDEVISRAFKYLKATTKDIQKAVSKDVLSFMNKPIDNESKNLYHKEYEKTLV
jgi:hypothetical protein